MIQKKTKETLYLTIINDLSEDIGISKEETKSLVDVALSSTDPRDVDYEQLKNENTIACGSMSQLKIHLFVANFFAS